MFLLPVKGRSSEEQMSPVCRKPDLDNLSLRVARLDAAVSIAARRSAEVEGIVSGADKWLESRLEEVTLKLQDHMDAHVEDLVRRLVTQMLCTEHKVPSEASTEAVEPSSCYAPSEVSLESDVVSASGSSSISSAVGQKPRARRIGVSKRRSLKTQAHSQVDVCNSTEPADEASPCKEVAEAGAHDKIVEPISDPPAAEPRLDRGKRALSKYRRPSQASSDDASRSALGDEHPPEHARPVPRRSSCRKQQSNLQGAAHDIGKKVDGGVLLGLQSLEHPPEIPKEETSCMLENVDSIGRGC